MLVATMFTSGSGNIYQGLNANIKVRSTEEGDEEYGKCKRWLNFINAKIYYY